MIVKRVNTEAEYWEAHKYYVRKLRKHGKNIRFFVRDMKGYLAEYDRILDEACLVGVFSSEWVEEQKRHIRSEIRRPDSYLDYIEDKRKKFLKKLKTGLKNE